jgi:hypothetical protein
MSEDAIVAFCFIGTTSFPFGVVMDGDPLVEGINDLGGGDGR